MLYYSIKLLISALLIVLISEVSKRYTLIAGLLASLPLVSFLGMIWLYLDTHDKQKVADLSWSILWLVIPSLSFFIALPLLLKKMSFFPSLLLSTVILFICYGLMLAAMCRLGLKT